MGDVFKEQLVKREKSTKELIIRAGIILLAFIVFAAFFIASGFVTFLAQLVPFVFVGVIFGAYFLIGQRNVEYEYIFTNGELDIDCVYNRNRRKRMFSGAIKSFEVFDKLESKAHASALNMIKEQRDYGCGVPKPNTYVFVASYKGKKMKILFEPNENLIKAMTPYLGKLRFM